MTPAVTSDSRLQPVIIRMSPRPFLLLSCIIVLTSCTAEGKGNGWPLNDAEDRPTPLFFGLYVTPDPDENPIDPPERFTGFHAATDFEISWWEQKRDVSVYAICKGEIAFSGFSEGYGGLVTQYCTIKGEPVTVIYGHLAVDSLIEKGTKAKAGEKLGILGAPRSHDTDGSRKHLHLGIRKGHGSDVRGYVQSEEELNDYLDPLSVLPL